MLVKFLAIERFQYFIINLLSKFHIIYQYMSFYTFNYKLKLNLIYFLTKLLKS